MVSSTQRGVLERPEHLYGGGPLFYPVSLPAVPIHQAQPEVPELYMFLGTGDARPDTYITVLPFIHPTGFQINILDLLCLFAIGCPLAFLFLRTIGDVPLFPARDPRLLESVNLSN